MHVVPSIDLRGGQVVRLQQGDYSRQIAYAADPVRTALDFAAAGAHWMHIVDLDGAKDGRVVQTQLIGNLIAASGLSVQVGGGVRSLDDIRQLLSAGAARVVVGTKAMEDWHWFEGLMALPELDRRIVLALDARDGIVATRGWTASSGRLAADVATWVSRWPLAGILYTDVARDGMLQGPNIPQTAALAAAAAPLPVIASGGVGSLEHIRQLAALPAPGVWGVVVGRSLYEGTLNLAEAIRLVSTGQDSR